jgi:D-3-phosphoglycerate dehydrogenase
MEWTKATVPRVLSLTPAAMIAPVHDELAARLAPHALVFAGERLDDELAAADVVIGDWTHATLLDAARLARAERCLCVLQPTAGVETIDLAAAARLGIPVASAPGANDVAVAEWAVMAILALLKDAWRHHAGVLEGRWDMVDAGSTGVFELAGRTVGIVGMGRIGRAVARRLAGFDVRLVYADAQPAPAEVERALALERMELDALLTAADAVTLHVPLGDATRGLIGARRLALMRPHAVLVNAARGAVLDEDALLAALDGGRLKAAALDVFAHEPLPPGDPLRGRPDVLLSPHLAGSTNEARRRMLGRALENLDRVLRGGPPADVVNDVAGVPRR